MDKDQVSKIVVNATETILSYFPQQYTGKKFEDWQVEQVTDDNFNIIDAYSRSLSLNLRSQSEIIEEVEHYISKAKKELARHLNESQVTVFAENPPAYGIFFIFCQKEILEQFLLELQANPTDKINRRQLFGKIVEQHKNLLPTKTPPIPPIMLTEKDINIYFARNEERFKRFENLKKTLSDDASFEAEVRKDIERLQTEIHQAEADYKNDAAQIRQGKRNPSTTTIVLEGNSHIVEYDVSKEKFEQIRFKNTLAIEFIKQVFMLNELKLSDIFEQHVQHHLHRYVQKFESRFVGAQEPKALLDKEIKMYRNALENENSNSIGVSIVQRMPTFQEMEDGKLKWELQEVIHFVNLQKWNHLNLDNGTALSNYLSKCEKRINHKWLKEDDTLITKEDEGKFGVFIIPVFAVVFYRYIKYLESKLEEENQGRSQQQETKIAKTLEKSRTKPIIEKCFAEMDRKGWEYAFRLESDYNTFVEVLTLFFEQKPYELPLSNIQLKRRCKTRLAKTLGEIYNELGQHHLRSDTEYLEIIRVLDAFQDGSDNQVVNLMYK